MKEKVSEQKVSAAIQYDRECQPPPESNNQRTNCNDAEGKRIRRVLTQFLDHMTDSHMYDNESIL